MNETMHIIAVAVLLLAAAINLVRRQWALNLLALALQYTCIFLVILEVRSPMLAGIKLIVGLMVSVMLYMTLVSSGWSSQSVNVDAFLPEKSFAGQSLFCLF